MFEKEIRYLEFIKTRYPHIPITKVDFPQGLEKYSDLVILNDEFVFQFSKYDWTLAYLENEIKAIPFVRQFVSVTLPNMERLDRETVKYSPIKGVPLIRDKILLLGSSEQDHIAEQMGGFLKQLHSIHVNTAKLNGIEESPVGLTREFWLSEYGEIKAKVYPYCDIHTKESVDLVFSQLASNESFLDYVPAVIHGDLIPEHFIFEKDFSMLKGITGFSLTGIGDPAYDVSFILNSLGETFFRRINRYYRCSKAVVNRARFYAFTRRLTWAKEVADMIATRDLTNFHFNLDESDVMPIGSK